MPDLTFLRRSVAFLLLLPLSGRVLLTHAFSVFVRRLVRQLLLLKKGDDHGFTGKDHFRQF